MTRPESSSDNFPLVSLQPVTNSSNAWAALLLALPAAAGFDSLVRLFDEFGLTDALGDLSCIVPLGQPASLSAEASAKLPSQRIILLLPLAVCVDPAAADELGRLQRLGFRLMAEGVPTAAQKLPAPITGIAIADAGVAGLQRSLRQWNGPHLATGVNTPAAHAQAQGAGCSLFAGEFALHPLPAQQQQGTSRALLLRLLGLVTGDADTHEIEVLLRQTPELSYQLLKLVNSVSFSLKNKISNFGQAIAILGRRQLQRWLQLLLYAQNRGDGHNPLMERAALRAALIEALCRASGGDREQQERAFMIGMFSLLDALFAMPMEDIVKPLNLAEDVVGALLRRTGRLGALLAIAERVDGAASDEFMARLAAAGLTPTTYGQSLVHACRWAIQVNREI